MDRFFLLLNNDSGRVRLHTATTESECDAFVIANANCRVSPVFAVVPQSATLPDLNNGSYVGFFTVENPFQTIGELYGQLSTSEASNLWFTYGIASLVVFEQDTSQLSRIKELITERVRAFERWSVQNHEVSFEEAWLAPTAIVDSNRFRIEYSADELDADTALLLQDIQLGLSSLVSCSSQHAPILLESFAALSERLTR